MQGMGGGGGGGGSGGAKMQQALTSMAGGGGGDIKKAVSSSGFARTLKKGQGALRSATIGVARSWAQMYQFVLILLLLFIIHQVPPNPCHAP